MLALGDSFGIRSLISTDFVFCYFFIVIESMEGRFVTTCAVNFCAFVDGQMWSLSGEFQDSKAFFRAELASTGTEGFDAA